MAERKTENLLEQSFRKAGFKEADFQFQGSIEEEIQRCLPSKKNGIPGKGKPEYLIRLNGDAADILVVECKADKADHTSNQKLTEISHLKPVEFAEDGILHYMKGLRKEFNVIGLAVSGSETLEITTFKAMRGGKIERLPNRSVLKPEDYLTILKTSNDYGKKSEEDIIKFAHDLHDYLRDNMELSEAYKPLIVSGILLGLKDNVFESSYRNISQKNDLADALCEAIQRVLKKAKVKDDKFDSIVSNYQFIRTNKHVKEFLQQTISRVYRNLFFALQPNSSFDLLGNFYGEFLRYSGGDKQGLGIVLTPRQITELFAELADLNAKESVVLDTCAGTAGFLIAAMANMIGKAHGDSRVIDSIKANRIVGVEMDSHMFTLACANMIFRGDGKANMFYDDCLKPKEPDTVSKIQKLKPNIAMLNPPYSKEEEGKEELCFVKRALDLIQPNGVGIAIVPVSALIDDSKRAIQIKKELLEAHTLKAVMSMPSQTFPTVGTVPAIIVFEAHKSHYKSTNTPRADTWFAYWHDDGFMLNKGKRVERTPGIWKKIKKEWIDSFFNQRIVRGKSFKRPVNHLEEWIAEAYMKTDYSKLSKAIFEQELKKYAIFKISGESKPPISDGNIK
jgi:type I restriction enzyme M protein